MGLFSSLILHDFMGVDHNSVKIKDKRVPFFLIELIDLMAQADISLPVLLLGEKAYNYPVTKRMR